MIRPLYVMIALFLFFLLMIPHCVPARDLGQWGNNDPEITKWYQSLHMPDNPPVSCCGDADSYWCDDVFVKDHMNYCRITDDRDDTERKRVHVPMGSVIQIPDRKFNHDGNPTGHVIVFLQWFEQPLSTGEQYIVYCFILNGGV